MTVEQILRAISSGLVQYSPITGQAYLPTQGTVPATMVRYLSAAGLLSITGLAIGGMQWVGLTDTGWAEVYRYDEAVAA